MCQSITDLQHLAPKSRTKRTVLNTADDSPAELRAELIREAERRFNLTTEPSAIYGSNLPSFLPDLQTWPTTERISSLQSLPELEKLDLPRYFDRKLCDIICSRPFCPCGKPVWKTFPPKIYYNLRNNGTLSRPRREAKGGMFKPIRLSKPGARVRGSKVNKQRQMIKKAANKNRPTTFADVKTVSMPDLTNLDLTITTNVRNALSKSMPAFMKTSGSQTSLVSSTSSGSGTPSAGGTLVRQPSTGQFPLEVPVCPMAHPSTRSQLARLYAINRVQPIRANRQTRAPNHLRPLELNLFIPSQT